jgi:hypothetical protein
MKSQKPDGLVLDFEGSDFPRIDRVWLEFEIQFILKRFFHIRVKELHPAIYINIGHEAIDGYNNQI